MGDLDVLGPIRNSADARVGARYTLGPPYGPRHWATVGSYGEAFSYERGTPVPSEKGTIQNKC